jgi:hypothetical protein
MAVMFRLGTRNILFRNQWPVYKTVTVVIMTIVSDAPNCGVITYDRN